MMSFTADGQMDPAALQERDRLLGINTGKIRESRKDWAADKPTPHPAADHPWRTGEVEAVQCLPQPKPGTCC
jgi:hypothetical protein